MKLAKILVFLFLIGSLIVPSAKAGFQTWDFEDAKQNKEWKVANGEWKMQKGIYQEVSGGESAMHSIVGDVKWDNYTVEAKVRLDKGNWAGLLFRAESEHEYYVFYMNVPDNKTELWVHSKPKWDSRATGQPQNYPALGKVKIKNGEWYHMKIKVEGKKFALTINDKEQGEGTSGTTYKAGKIGVWCWKTEASFDDVKITGGNVKTLAVDPQHKLATTWGSLKRSP